MFFLVSLGFLSIVFVLTLLDKIRLAENLLAMLFLLLAIYTTHVFIFQIIANHSFTLDKKILKIINRAAKPFAIICVVSLFIYTAFDSTYYFGGDDTRLYFKYSNEYYSNFVSHLVTNNTLSNIGNFLPSTSISFFTLTLYFLNLIFPFLNLQSFLYISNVLLGAYFFYMFLSYISPNSSHRKTILAICSSLYVLSIFNIYTLYNSKLIAVFLISIFPAFLYLFVRSVYEKKLHYIFILAILFSAFGIVSVSSFWFFASVITVSPILIYLIFPYWKRAISYLIILAFCLFALNIHWIYYMPHTSITSEIEGVSNSISSEEFLAKNAEGVRSTTSINSLFYPLMNSYHRQIQLNFNWPYKTLYENWYFTILPLNFIFIGIIFMAGAIQRKNDKGSILYVISGISFILGVYLFSVNIGVFKFGELGIESFVWLVNNVPGFVVFRNMYDKFGHGLSVSFSVLLAISLILLFNKISSNMAKNTILVALGAVIVLNAKPFLLGEFDHLPIWTTSNMYQGITDFHKDYIELTEYVKNQEYRGRYLFLPMTVGNVIAIPDENSSNHYYVGVSPFVILSGKNDYSGILSFGVYQEALKRALYDSDFESVALIFQDTNVKYIILNKTVPEEMKHGYMYSDYLYEYQNQDFVDFIVGEKIRDFGESYTLYSINQNYDNEKIFLSNDDKFDPMLRQKVNYKQLSTNRYSISISDLESSSKIVFNDENDNGWKLYSSSGKEVGTRASTSGPYKNVWTLNANEINNDDHLDLIFEPAKLQSTLFALSTGFYLLFIIYSIYMVYMDLKKKR